MSRRWWLLAGILGLCCLGAERKAERNSTPPRWLNDWEQGRKAARDSGKPIFVVFRCEN
jgi:hypothetical protein